MNRTLLLYMFMDVIRLKTARQRDISDSYTQFINRSSRPPTRVASSSGGGSSLPVCVSSFLSDGRAFLAKSSVLIGDIIVYTYALFPNSAFALYDIL